MKLTSAKIGRLLAAEFTKTVLKSFNDELIQDINSSVFSTDTSKSVLLKEWIFLNMFGMFQGILSYFRGAQQGFRLSKEFNESCSEILTKADVFNDTKIFIETLIYRYGIYYRALTNSKEPGPTYWLSKQFCQFCGIYSDPILKTSIATYYVYKVESNEKLIADLLKTIVVEEEKNDDWKTLVHKSFEYGRKGDYWKSIEFAYETLKLNPLVAEAWRLIGNDYELIGDEKEIEGNYIETIEYHEKATEAWDSAKIILPTILIPGYHK